MEILNHFGVQPVLLAAQVVNFLILLFILKKLFYQPILKILEERKKRIADSLKNTEEIEKRLLTLAEEEQKRIAKATAEGEKIIRQATESGLQIMEDAKARYESIINQANEDAKKIHQTEKEKLMTEVKDNLTELMLMIFKKVTGKALEKKDHRELIEKEVKNLS